jgi:hypothetical protein
MCPPFAFIITLGKPALRGLHRDAVAILRSVSGIGQESYPWLPVQVLSTHEGPARAGPSACPMDRIRSAFS